LQQHLGDKQALISFYVAKEALHVFILTRSSFAYTRIDSEKGLQHDVEDWLGLLKTTENGKKFRGEATGSRLYRQLIKPIQAIVPQKDEWVIIPDGFLYFLPFESLPAGAEAGSGSGTLLETTTISYQFSSRLLVAPSPPKIDHSLAKILAFAPFAGKGGGFDQPGLTTGAASGAAAAGATGTAGGTAWFSQLPASGEEIAGLPGRLYMDSLATKEQFLKEINKYPVVHLATHAVSSINNASASFIAFYPEKRSPIEDCLFLEELYGLNMNATNLVIISACETGQGELVSNEGVISLARAFAYAGCASTINSLWKADDKATSFILRRFHAYLQKGYTKSKALQQAKLDYLGSDAINKSPAYWSHLILIGNIEPVYSGGNSYKWGILIIASCLLILIFWRGREWKKRKKKSTLFMDAGI
jgi:CHAT domain-containing protein